MIDVCAFVVGLSLVSYGQEPIYLGRPLNFWSERLEDSDLLVRREAARALGNMGPKAAPAIPVLIAALKDRVLTRQPIDFLSGESIENELATALGKIGAEAVPLLIEYLDHQNSDVRCWAAITLGHIGPDAAAAVTKLVDLLSDPDVRLCAAVALGKIGPASAPAVPILKNWLDDYSLVGAAVAAIGNIGPDARDASYALAKVHCRYADSEKGQVTAISAEAALALWKIGPSAVPTLAAGLRDQNDSVRFHSARALARFRSEAKEAVPDLIQAGRDKRGEVREAAIRALGSIGPDANKAIPLLREMLQDSEPSVRKAAAQALRLVSNP